MSQRVIQNKSVIGGSAVSGGPVWSCSLMRLHLSHVASRTLRACRAAIIKVVDGKRLSWLGGRDSNPDTVVQRAVFSHTFDPGRELPREYGRPGEVSALSCTGRAH